MTLFIEHLGKKRIALYSAGKFKSDARNFLDKLPTLIETMYHDYDVLLCQDGVDPHVNDPLGCWMTIEELLERDTLVFKKWRELELPVVWCLSGGYIRDPDVDISQVLQIHDNTMKACLGANCQNFKIVEERSSQMPNLLVIKGE